MPTPVSPDGPDLTSDTSGSSSRSPDKTSITVAKWTAISAVIVALISLAGNIFQAVHNNGGSTPTAVKPELGPFGPPNGDSNIGQVVNLSGPVSGLARGQMVWTFNEPLRPNGGTVFPNTGPCEVSGKTWTCNNIFIGESPTTRNPKAGQGRYLIWAAVVSEQDAFDIVSHLRCNPTPQSPCNQTYTRSTLPGRDILPPQKIRVTRTH